MASDLTQRQRAEALYGSLTCTTYREGYSRTGKGWEGEDENETMD